MRVLQRINSRTKTWLLAAFLASAMIVLVINISSAHAFGADAFVITVDTSLPGVSGSNEFTIGTTGGGYNYSVDCDDDGTPEATGQTGDYTCSYAVPNTYTIAITGTFPRIYLTSHYATSDAEKLQEIVQWGTGAWTSFERAFEGTYSLYSVSATDVPNLSGVTSLAYMFADSGLLYINNAASWDTSTITNMTGMFKGANFNDDVSAWDTSNVINMSNMFSGATSFNQNLGNWSIASLTDATNMFYSSGLSTANYDALLLGWSSQSPAIQSGVPFSAGTTRYSNNTARSALTTTHGWAISDGGECYSVTFMATGSDSGTPPDTQYKVPSTELALPTNTAYLRKQGFVLTGWNTASNGTGTHYDLGGVYSTDVDVTLYPDWHVLNKAPGGVKNGLASWYKADQNANHTAGVGATDGQTVAEWKDAVLELSNLTNPTAANQPIYHASGFNFNPYLSFNGAAWPNYQYLRNETYKQFSGDQDFSIFNASETEPGQIDGGSQYAIGTPNVSSNVAYYPNFGIVGRKHYLFYNDIDIPGTVYNAKEIIGTTRSTIFGDNHYAYVNNQGVGARYSSPIDIVSPAPFTIGGYYNRTGYPGYVGKIPEFIVFNTSISDNERNRVSTYLAIKYGMPLDQATPQDYLASDNSIAWDYARASAATYKHDVFGVGRDDASDLAQVISKSSNNDSVLTMLLEGESSSNSNKKSDLTFTDLGDRDFLVVGDNNGTNTWTPTGAPSGYKLLERAWVGQERATDTGSVRYSFDVDATGFNIPTASYSGSYYFVSDTNNNKSLADDTPVAMTNTSGSTWSISRNLADDTLFTIASEATNYTVTYDGNGADSGTVPTDGTSPYAPGTSVNVLSNTGGLQKTGYSFNGWNTASDGTGTNYSPGASFTISSTTTLYAQWQAAAASDSDDDGVPNTVEDGGFNGGDGNGDGIADKTQLDVATSTNPATGTSATLVIDGACNNVSESRFVSESMLEKPDATADYPVGLVDFRASCVGLGLSTTITIFYSQAYDTSSWRYKKYDSTGKEYADITSRVTFGTAIVGGKSVTTASFVATDGDPQTDEDKTANGVIVDPSGPAVLVASTSLAHKLLDTGKAILLISIVASMITVTAFVIVHYRSQTGR